MAQQAKKTSIALVLLASGLARADKQADKQGEAQATKPTWQPSESAMKVLQGGQRGGYAAIQLFGVQDPGGAAGYVMAHAQEPAVWVDYAEDWLSLRWDWSQYPDPSNTNAVELYWTQALVREHWVFDASQSGCQTFPIGFCSVHTGSEATLSPRGAIATIELVPSEQSTVFADPLSAEALFSGEAFAYAAVEHVPADTWNTDALAVYVPPPSGCRDIPMQTVYRANGDRALVVNDFGDCTGPQGTERVIETSIEAPGATSLSAAHCGQGAAWPGAMCALLPVNVAAGEVLSLEAAAAPLDLVDIDGNGRFELADVVIQASDPQVDWTADGALDREDTRTLAILEHAGLGTCGTELYPCSEPMGSRLAVETVTERYASAVAGSSNAAVQLTVADDTDSVFAALCGGTAEVAMTPRFMSDAEQVACQGRGPLEVPVAWAATVVATSPDNDWLHKLDADLLVSLLRARTWYEAYQEWPQEERRWYILSDDSWFNRVVEAGPLEGVSIQDGADLRGLYRVDWTRELVDSLLADTLGVGLVPYSVAVERGLSIPRYEGQFPDIETIRAGGYPLAQPLVLTLADDACSNADLALVDAILDTGATAALDQDLVPTAPDETETMLLDHIERCMQ